MTNGNFRSLLLNSRLKIAGNEMIFTLSETQFSVKTLKLINERSENAKNLKALKEPIHFRSLISNDKDEKYRVVDGNRIALALKIPLQSPASKFSKSEVNKLVEEKLEKKFETHFFQNSRLPPNQSLGFKII